MMCLSLLIRIVLSASCRLLPDRSKWILYAFSYYAWSAKPGFHPSWFAREKLGRPTRDIEILTAAAV